MSDVEDLSFNYFKSEDIVRHPVVAKVVQAYEKWDEEEQLRRKALAEQRRQAKLEEQRNDE